MIRERSRRLRVRSRGDPGCVIDVQGEANNELGSRGEGLDVVQIIMSRIMFYYVSNYVLLRFIMFFGRIRCLVAF